MAYERLDIEVSDNGSSRRVQRSLEEMGRAGARSAAEVAQEVARMATSGARSGQTFAAALRDLQGQFNTTTRASLMASTGISTVAAAALAASRPIANLALATTIYSSAAGGSVRASLLASTGMVTVARSASIAARTVAIAALAMNAQANAAGRMARANLLASTAMRTIAGGSLGGGSGPIIDLLPSPPTAAAAMSWTDRLAAALARVRQAATQARQGAGQLFSSVSTAAQGATSRVRAWTPVGGSGGGSGGGGGTPPGPMPSGAGAAGAARGLSSVEDAAKRASSALITMNTLMYSLQIGMIAVLAVKWADEWQSIQNKLDLVTTSTDELGAANERLFQIAQRTRSGYADVVELFQSLRLQAENLGLSMKATADLTETVSMASQIGSRGAAQASAGVLQFTQALALGRLSGQNLNSVLQSTPRIAIAVAQGMGVTTAALRQLAEDEKLTADVLVKALQDQAPKIAEEFFKLKPTISGAFTVLSNAAIKFTGDLEKTTGFASVLSSTIITLAGNMDLLAAAVVIVGSALLVAFGGAVQRAIHATMIAIAANPLGAMIALATATYAVFTLLQDRFEQYPGLMAAFAGAVAVVATVLAGPLVVSFLASAKAALAFTAALLTNPLTWIAVAIGVVVAALVYFGAKSHEVNGKTISGWNYLKAVGAGVWSALGAGVAALWESMKLAFTQMLNGLMGIGQALYYIITGDFEKAWDAGKAALGNIAGSYYEAYVGGWLKVGAAMGNAYTEAFNASVAAAPPVVPKAETGTTDLSDVPGVPVPYGSDKDKDKNKKGSKRLTRDELISQEMARIIAETKTAQNTAITYLNRAAYEAIDKFNEELRRRRDPLLTKDEQDNMLMALLTLERVKRVQQQRDDITRQALGPAQDYLDAIDAINGMQGKTAVSAEQMARATRKATMAYLESKTDLKSGLDLGKLRAESEVADGGAARGANAYGSYWQDANRGLLEFQASMAALQQLMRDDPINSGQYELQLRKLGQAQLELQLRLNDASFFDALSAGFGRLTNDFQGLIPGLADAWGGFFDTFASGFADSVGRAIVYSENLGQALGDVARSAIAGLISALVKLGIQWLVMQVIGQAAQTAVTATGVASGAAMTAAWTPAAIAVSLATFGANAPPAMAGMGATYALGAALSSVAGKAPGMATGGEVHGPGTGTSDSVPRWLSDGEFVVNAAATARNLPFLHAINSGQSTPGLRSGGYVGYSGTGTTPTMVDRGRAEGGQSSGTGMNVQVLNYAAATVEIERTSPTDMRLIMREEIRKQTPDVMAGEIRNPSSRTSRALGNHTKTVRKRG